MFYYCKYISVAAPLQDCNQVEENVAPSEENDEEETRLAGDLPEGLQDNGEHMEERSEEEIASGTSPPQVPPKHLSQLSSGDGEYSSEVITFLFDPKMLLLSTPLPKCFLCWTLKYYSILFYSS